VREAFHVSVCINALKLLLSTLRLAKVRAELDMTNWMLMRIFLSSLCVAGLCLSGHLCAKTTQPIAENTVGEWQFALSLGTGKVTTPLANRHDLQGSVLPAVSYYGEHFYLENSFIGYSLVEQDNWYLDLVGGLNDDGYFFELDGVNQFGWWDALGIEGGYSLQLEGEGPAQLPGTYQDIKRNLSYMAGASVNWLTDIAEVRLTLLTDISGVHQGQEQHFSLRKTYEYQQWQFRWQIGALHKDEQINNYYYNLRPHELDNTNSWFRLGDSWQYFYALTINYQLDPNWAIQAFWQKNLLDKELMKSPLVAKDQSYSRFIGVRYSF
jgi:MipA family protein